MMNDGWPPEVQRAHVALIHYIWIERVPEALSFCGFDLKDAWNTWAMFVENPKNPKLDKIKRLVNEEFRRLVLLN